MYYAFGLRGLNSRASFVCVISYWHVESEPVFEHTAVANPLPSDCRFREDLIALKVIMTLACTHSL